MKFAEAYGGNIDQPYRSPFTLLGCAENDVPAFLENHVGR